MKIREVLQSFCNPGHPKLVVPWSRDGYTYATNSHALLRVEWIADIPDNPEAPIIPTSNTDFPFDEIPAEWLPLPEVTKNMGPCKDCLGTGLTYECPECDGHGTILHYTAYNEYENDCESCDDTGFVDKKFFEDHKIDTKDRKTRECENCGGKGQVLADNFIRIGGVRFDANLLSLFNQLEDVRIGILAVNRPAVVKFNGGMALIAPMREYR